MVRSFVRNCLALLAFGLLAGSAAGQTTYTDVDLPDAKIAARSAYSWPADCGFGYVPIKVELSNRGDRSQMITVEARDGRGRRAGLTRHERRIELEAGESAELWMLTPNFIYQDRGQPTVSIEVAGERRSLSQPSASKAGSSCAFVLGVGSRPAPIGTNATVGGLIGTSLSGLGTGLSEGRFGAVSWSELPDTWEAYSSLDVVVVDASNAPGMERHLEPILAWVRLGGKLVLVGEPNVDTLQSYAGLGQAFEQRRLIPNSGNTLKFGTPYSYGLGRIALVGAAFDWTGSAWVDAAARAGSLLVQNRRARLTPSPGNWQLDRPMLTIPGIGSLPLRGFLVGLLLFAVLIGPVNLLVLKRMQRPALLLITIPGLSLAATACILLFGIFDQGLDVKQAEWSVSHLDQVSKRVADLSMRAVYAGSSPGAGLRPGAGTAIFPERRMGNEEVYVVEQTGEGRVFRGSFLPVREVFSQVVMREAASRQRVEVSMGNGRVEVQNSLKSTISMLAYHADNGDWYSVRDLDPGDNAAAKLDPKMAQSLDAALTGDFGGGFHVPPGSYLARVERNPFGDDLGIEVTELGNVHYVIGLLEQGEVR
ncbi:MAG: hypothetical protein ACI8QC_000381 [Planctomycetota bacterium]|jgi:hypothetical protein